MYAAWALRPLCSSIRAECVALIVLLAAARARIVPESTCSAGFYFDSVQQLCASCQSLSPHTDWSQADGGVCFCSLGFVECRFGQRCWAGSPGDTSVEFSGEGSLDCRECPSLDGVRTAPTQDRTACLPCDPNLTQGYSEDIADCLCPQGRALIERKDDGSYLPMKKCVQCAGDFAAGTDAGSASFYGCIPCTDPHRMYRDPFTGVCQCKVEGFVAAGGACIDETEFELINNRYPEATAVEVTFRDFVDTNPDFWEEGPFGTNLGIEEQTYNPVEVLGLDTVRDTIIITSAVIKWLYLRNAAGCLRGNATACQCLSNLCVLALYDDEATVCRSLEALEGLPVLFATKRAMQTIEDTSLNWKFTLQDRLEGEIGTTNSLILWLASYNTEGTWLGWEQLTSQLDLCARLGGISAVPRSPPSAWLRFGSSLRSKCRVSLSKLKQCGADPTFYDLFAENVDGQLVPVPVRILNLVRNQQRPNLNRIPEDLPNDVYVRRFTLCDALSGREGPVPEAYLEQTYSPTVFRWAAHMAVQVELRPDSEGQIFVPVLSIAYAAQRGTAANSALTTVSFKAEYSMNTSTYWTVISVLLAFTIASMAALVAWRLYLLERRFPTLTAAVASTQQGLFVAKPVIQALIFLTTVYSMLFWFHFSITLYWFIMFKAQNAPHVLLPSAFEGDEYEPHDIVLVLSLFLGLFSVGLGLFKQLKVFIFLVDWERGTLAPERGTSLDQRASTLGAAVAMASRPVGGSPQQMPMHGSGRLSEMAGPNMVGAPLLSSMGHLAEPGHEGAVGVQRQAQGLPQAQESPDGSVSAWRTLFVCNELNERLTATRTISHVTWILVATFLEGFDWKSAARWYPRFSGEEAMLTAQYNPFLQFCLGACAWLIALVLQLIYQRISTIFLGHDLTDFIDLCSVANVSVFFLDEPCHGFYIHGKAPSSRGDWGHTDLATVLCKESKGIGFNRGLTRDGCQTFEMFLPPELSIPFNGGGMAHFRRTLLQTYGEVDATLGVMASRRPEKPSEGEITRMSQHRIAVQALIDSTVHAVMRGVDQVVRRRSSIDWFWGAPPEGGVGALRIPVFYKDQDGPAWPHGLAWTSCLAHGAELRLAGVGLPTGFEWHLSLLEFLLFSVIWRFQGSIYLSVCVAFTLNGVVRCIYAGLGRRRLAYTTIINEMFLI